MRTSIGTRRQRERSLHQTRHPLFVIVAGRKAIGHSTQRHCHFVGRKAIVRHLAGRTKPHDTRLIGFRGRMERRLPQSNNELRGTWRGVCQVVHVTTIRIFTTTASRLDIGKQSVGKFIQSFILEIAQSREECGE